VLSIWAIPYALDLGLSACCRHPDSLPQSFASARHSDLFQCGYSHFINALAYDLAIAGVHKDVFVQLASICTATAAACAGLGKNGVDKNASSQLKYPANILFI
jgi:hypothetical protein